MLTILESEVRLLRIICFQGEVFLVAVLWGTPTKQQVVKAFTRPWLVAAFRPSLHFPQSDKPSLPCSAAPRLREHEQVELARNREQHLQDALWFTVITEVGVLCDKCYLSPILDCFDGKLASWTIGMKPNADLANKNLIDACFQLVDGERPKDSPGWMNPVQFRRPLGLTLR